MRARLWARTDRRRGTAAWLFALLLGYLLLTSLYNWAVPLGEGPDEPGHADYVFFLAREGRLPVQRADVTQSDVPGEGHQPPLAYALASLVIRWLPLEERQIEQPGNANFTWAGGSAVNAVAHGTRELWPWRGAVLAWHVARAVSGLWGAATIVLSYLAAAAFVRLTGHAQERGGWVFMPLAAAALVALNPQFLFTTALVTNDALLTALSALVLWLLLTIYERQLRNDLRQWLALGGALGFALITKQSAVLLLPVVLVSGGVLALAVSPAGWRSAAWQALAKRLALSYGVAALVSGWWYWRNWRLYGDPFGLSAFRAEFTTQPFAAGSLAAWGSALQQLHDSFWAYFGWLNLPGPAWVFWLCAALELCAVAGLVLAFRRAGWRNLWCWTPVVTLLLLAFAWLVSFAFTAGLVAWQGRLLFPALPAIALSLAYGLAWVLRQKRAQLLGWGGLLIGIALAVWLPFGVIRPAYPWQVLSEQAALARIAQPAAGRFGLEGDRGAELRGWWSQVGPEQLDVGLVWYSPERQGHDWTVFVHLLNVQGEVVAQSDAQPRGGAFPMTQWSAGDWVEDRHVLTLPSDLAAGSYTLRVGLYDREGNGQRAALLNAKAEPIGDDLDLGTIDITR